MSKQQESLTVTLIQPNLHWEDIAANLEMLGNRIDAISEKLELVVLPEMFSTGFSMRPAQLAETMQGSALDWMRNVARNKKIVLTGSLIIAENGQYYNRLIWMLPNGSFGQYDKRHLFAYAGEDKQYHPGASRFIASLKGWKLNLQVCYDLRFPVWARQTNPVELQPEDAAAEPQEPEYDVLVYVANWPERRSHAWKTLLQARAIENQCWVAGVNRVGTDGNGIHYCGDSMVVDPLGGIVATVTAREEVITYSLSRQRLEEVRAKWPFLKDADRFVIGR